MPNKIDLVTQTRNSVKAYLQHMDTYKANDLYHVVINEIEKGVILEVLAHCDNNQSDASQILGITRTTLRNKIRKHNLTLND